MYNNFLMKKLYVFFLFMAVVFTATAQSPLGISYQAIVRNTTGDILANQNVALRISLLHGSITGSAAYVETHAVQSNPFGMINIIIGNGTIVTGVFDSVNWAEGPYFVKLELDAAGGNNFTDLGTSQMMSVPYALFAKKAGNLPTGVNSGDMMYWNGNSWIMIPGGQYGQTLHYCDGVPTWGNCLPKVSSFQISNTTTNSAVSGGEVTSDGGATITARGVCWNSSGNPTISDSHTSNGTGTGIFASSLTGLTAGTSYFVKAYATNSAGTSYGNEVTFTTQGSSSQTFTCGTSTISDFDGNTYNTVQIGSQCWMKENLATTHYADGTALVDGTAAGNLGYNNTTKYWFVNNNTISNKAVYGLLYTWAAAMNGASSSAAIPSGIQGVCPTGWHLPSEAEWTQLTTFLGGESVAGGKLKEAGTSYWNSPNAGATNSSGFTALPGGNRNYDGFFNDVGLTGLWWSSTEDSAIHAWDRLLDCNFAQVVPYYGDKTAGFSVRCVYGNDDSQVSLTTVTTSAISEITQTSATGGGDVTSNGGAAITARGLCWNTSGSPTISDSHTSDGSGTGTFTSSLTGLTAGTTYHVKAYATNGVGTSYGNEVTFTTQTSTSQTFTCGTSTLTDFDGNTYNTVQIGEQCWMKENLATTHYADGTVLVDGTNAGDISNNYTTKYWFVYDNNSANKSTYGLLYTWAAAMNGSVSSSSNPSGVQGVCPAGWHLPSDNEWKQLELALGMTQTQADATGARGTDQGGELKEIGTSHWASPNTGATNQSGFTALPGGSRSYGGSFSYLGDYGNWWTAAENTTYVWLRNLYYNSAQVNRYYNLKNIGISVRCLLDNNTSNSTQIPSVTTSPISGITQTSATGGGDVTSDGGAAITARGVCWNTSGSPTIADSHTSDGSGTGAFTSSLTGLTASTTYHVKAYATNSAGTSYGNEVTFTTQSSTSPTFTCGTSTINDFDGNTYNTVQIGEQCWMKENLATTHYADGTALVDGTNAGDIGTVNPTKYWFVYNNNISNKATYGLLYTWAAAMNGAASSATIPSGIQGVCPGGWHLPSDAEWTQLTNFLGGENVAGAKMKETGTSHWHSSSPETTNESGFTGLPGGVRTYNNVFDIILYYGYWWSATESEGTKSWYRSMASSSSYVTRSDFLDNTNAFSVRCVKDVSGSQVSIPTVTTSAISGIAQTSATGGGDVTSNGGAAITARGVCWNTSGSPTISDSHTSDGTGTGTFTSSLTGLTAGTTYHVKAYSTNSAGTSYGIVVTFTTQSSTSPTFTCGTSTINDFDGNTYNTVQIGNQCWMKENLASTHYADGTALVDGINAGYIGTDDATKYWFTYDNYMEYKAIYGLLYTWSAAVNGTVGSIANPSGIQGVCPSGWHLPSDAEWKQMEMFLGMTQAQADATGFRGTNEGGKLKEAGTLHWNSPNTGATNESGFAGLPGGARSYSNQFVYNEQEAYFFTATENSEFTAIFRSLYYSSSGINRQEGGAKTGGFSVRCVMNN
jgi:uncharacterized protein (TIGR02145 family)